MPSLSNERLPNAVYQHLRIATGLSPKSDQATETGLNNTLHFTCLKDDNGTYIGMGRVVGDGGTACQVVDICVLPAYQGQGFGKLIMQDIMHFINTRLPRTCYISLIADGPANRLYERFGFKDTLPASRGMYYRR